MQGQRLWLLEFRDQENDGPDWEQHYGFVVRAESEIDARIEAMLYCVLLRIYNLSWPEEDWWGDPDRTTCTELTADGQTSVVLASNKGA